MPVKIRPRKLNRARLREQELKQAEQNRKNAAKYKKEIERLYKQSLREVQKEIEFQYNKYATEHGFTLADAKRRLSKADAREWMEANDNWKANPHSVEAQEDYELIDAKAQINRLELIKAKIGLLLLEHQEVLDEYFHGRLTEEAVRELEKQAGIFGDFIGVNLPERIEAMVNEPFYDAVWSDRIWQYQDDLKHDLEKMLTKALVIGRNPKHPEFVKELQKTFGVSQYRAETLLVTEMARVQTSAQKFSFLHNGYEEYEFICCGGGAGGNPNDPCKDCQELDGQVFKVSEMQPGENAAPKHPGCHCSCSAYYRN